MFSSLPGRATTPNAADDNFAIGMKSHEFEGVYPSVLIYEWLFLIMWPYFYFYIVKFMQDKSFVYRFVIQYLFSEIS